MHIVRVCHLFYPDMQTDYFLELSMQQVKIGHEVDVVTWNRKQCYSEESVANGFTIYRLPGFNFSVDGAITEYPYLPSLPQKIGGLRPEIIHAESYLFLTTIQAIKEAKKLGIPSVVTVHGVMSIRNAILNLAQYAYLCTLGLWVFKNANRVICLTKSDAQEITRFGCPSGKIRVIPNAIDANRFRLGKDSQKNLVVWVGRFVPEKGLEYLVEAAKIVAKEFKEVKFLLIGYGPLRAKIMRLAHDRGLLNSSVFFTGALSRDEVAKILGKATVFVFPSLKEGLPVSILEAMASGVPVVGSNIPGLNAIITHREHGILVPPKNPEALANSIMLLLEDESLRMKLGQNARRLMVEKYSWDMISEKIENVYYEAMEKVE